MELGYESVLDIELSTSILELVCRRRLEGFIGSGNEKIFPCIT
jgi:hypothetical protein